MQLHISMQDGVPIYLQIVSQMKYLVASGRLRPGEEVPPIRTLAQELLINPNTVARAYRELENAGLLTSRRGAGTYVSDRGSPLADAERTRILSGRVDALLAQAGLLAALAHRPDLLLLDEPSSGLDAVVRRDILGAIIRTVADEGRTVLFSSHLLDEVERVADYIAMIYRGKLVLCAPLDDLKAGHRRVTLQFPEPIAAPPGLPGALDWQGHGRDWTALCGGPLDAFCQAAAEIATEAVPTLEEIFVARVKGGRNHTEG
jgi:DNA-binding transcriptional regulator YhcF (GntR family)